MPDSILRADNISSLSGGGVGIPDGNPSTPGLKFTNDGDTGLYRIGNNTIGILSNGQRVGEIGNGYGGFTGNVIQFVNSENKFVQSHSNNGYWVDINSSSGVPWEVLITPKYNNSKIILVYSLQMIFSSNTSNAYAGVAINRKVGSGSYSLISEPVRDVNGSYQYGIGVGGSSSTSFYAQFTHFYVDTPNTTLPCSYKLSGRTYQADDTIQFNVSATQGSSTSAIILLEVQQ